MSRHGKQGAKRPDANTLRAWIGNQQMTTSLGVVRKFPGESSHFEVDTENGSNDILVDVELIPSGTRTAARLGFGNDGVYRIPREDTEVAVLIPYDPSSLIRDSLDYGAIIVGVLNSNAPSELDADDVVVIESDKVTVISGTIKLGSNSASQKAVKGNVYRSAEDSWFTALNALATALSVYAIAIKPIADPLNAATPALTAACTAVNTALATFNASASSYLATKVSVE